MSIEIFETINGIRLHLFARCAEDKIIVSLVKRNALQWQTRLSQIQVVEFLKQANVVMRNHCPYYRISVSDWPTISISAPDDDRCWRGILVHDFKVASFIRWLERNTSTGDGDGDGGDAK